MLTNMFWNVVQLMGVFIVLFLCALLLIVGVWVIVLFIKAAVLSFKEMKIKGKTDLKPKSTAEITEPGFYQVNKNGEFIKIEITEGATKR